MGEILENSFEFYEERIEELEAELEKARKKAKKWKKKYNELKNTIFTTPGGSGVDDYYTFPIDKFTFDYKPTYTVPDACKKCPKHPSNGGDGICHCILGTPTITC